MNKLKYMFRLRKGFIIVFLIGFLLVWLVSEYGPQSPWTDKEIEERCGLPPTHDQFSGIGNSLQRGWDSSHRYYATEVTGGVTVLDRHNERCCTFGIPTAWFHAAFSTDTYDIHYHNQYGWSATTSLNLEQWEITTIVSGSCFQWTGCQTLDPPRVTVLGYCDPTKVYDPAGLF